MQTRLPTGMFRPSVYVPPRRRRGWIMVAIAVVLTLITATVAWASMSDPIVSGSYGFNPVWTDDGSLLQERFAADPVDGTPFTYYAAVERLGVPLSYAFSIRNDGPVPITIRSVGDTTGIRAVAADTDPLVGKVTSEVPVDAANGWVTPFVPFRLAPDAEAIIVVETTVTECNARDGVSTIASVPISYSVLGVPRSTSFIPNLQIGLRGSGCGG